MRHTHLTLAILLAIFMTGCVLGGKPLTKSGQSAPPAAPSKPAPITPVAAAPPPALSTPQTNVRLPAPQPVTPEALATTLPPEDPPPAPVAVPKPPPRNRPSNTSSSSVPATQPAAPPEAERAPVQMVPQGELTRLHDEAAASKREARLRVSRVVARPMNRQQRNTIDRIESFLKQSDDMERRGDLRQANELAGKALALSRELK